MTVNVQIEGKYSIPVDTCVSCGKNTPTHMVEVKYVRVIPLLVVMLTTRFNLSVPSCDYCAPYFKKYKSIEVLWIILWVVAMIALPILLIVLGNRIENDSLRSAIFISAFVTIGFFLFSFQIPKKIARNSIRKEYSDFHTVIIQKNLGEDGFLLKFENEVYGNKFKVVNTSNT